MPQIERIATLRGALTVRCYTCGHKVTWSTRQASHKLGGECTVFDARRRLWCSACGEREPSRIIFSS
jgi:DNA-directed RNA polymerase subunit RPC12/RpoP